MKILVCIEPSAAAHAAASLVSRLGFPPETNIVLLGVLEADIKQAALADSMKHISIENLKVYKNIQHQFREGEAADQIMEEAEQGAYDLIVVGDESHHRFFSPRKISSTITKLSHRLETPLLIARFIPEKINQILICSSAESFASATLTQGSQIVSFCQAPITILHVMSQISLRNRGTVEDLLDTAETAMQRRTREGNYLLNAIQQIRAAGVSSTIQPRLRHGLVLEEVVAEIKELGADILVIGSHHQPGQSWLVEHLLEDVSKDLLRDAPCSVLVV